MYIHRNLQPALDKYLKNFPVVGLTGPRQSGKSTMLEHCLPPDYRYVTFDDIDTQRLFYEDPKRFMKIYNHKIVFDEVQKAPEIFSAIKVLVDNNRQEYGQFILTGSSQFKLLQQISESLAGRIGLLTLLPLQYKEAPNAIAQQATFCGSYPELATRSYMNADIWYKSYINTYLEKDVRVIENIGDLRDFRRLMQLLASNIGQTLNMARLAKDVGVSNTTIKRWISVLEASYIIYLLPAYYKNYRKRITKSPKVYFIDTGLAAHMCGIQNESMYEQGPMYGALFENYVIIEMLKNILHSDAMADMYFFRDSNGEEVDLLCEANGKLSLFEIKTSYSYKSNMTKTLFNFGQIASADSCTLLYQGDSMQFGDNANVNSESVYNVWEFLNLI